MPFKIDVERHRRLAGKRKEAKRRILAATVKDENIVGGMPRRRDRP